MRLGPLTAVVSLSLLLSGGAAAQALQDTNRPGFSWSPGIIDAGNWQLETGIDYAKDREGAGFTAVTLPVADLRFGLSNDFELTALWAGVSRISSSGSTTTGVTDAAIGVKLRVTDEDARFAASFLALLSLPVGDSEFSSDSLDPSIGLAWAMAGTLDWFGTALVRKNGGDYTIDNGVGIAFARTERTSAFAEWEVQIPDDGNAVHSLNGGYLWSMNRKVQFDINLGIGLNDRAADFELGAGWSYRF